MRESESTLRSQARARSLGTIRWVLVALSALLAVVLAAAPAAAQQRAGSASLACLRCHGSREFLERHIDASRFLDFVSMRSPVFKERPLPKSKKEAIDLMMRNPNLIRRPILVKGSKVIFGFDKDAYRR